MTIAVLSGRKEHLHDAAIVRMMESLRSAGYEMELVEKDGSIPDGVGMLLSVGGDGTFLVAASKAAPAGVPVLGVNLGRLGFLSENTAEDVTKALLQKEYAIERRMILEVRCGNSKHYAFNEVAVNRSGASMLGVEVLLDSMPLPVYWADGLLVATPSGSTAYSLSAGGPIVMPQSNVLIVTPIAPHNLNVRPLVVPSDKELVLRFRSRDGKVNLSCDTDSSLVDAGSKVHVKVADFSLKRVCLNNSNFIKALSDKLFWGEDKRNEQK